MGFKWRGGYRWVYDEFVGSYYADKFEWIMAIGAWTGLTIFWSFIGLVLLITIYAAFVNFFWLFYHSSCTTLYC